MAPGAPNVRSICGSSPAGEARGGLDLVVPAPGGALVGRVLAGDTGQPVAGATVLTAAEVNGRAAPAIRADLVTYSRPDGTFQMADLSAGRYALTARHPDFPLLSR